MQTKRQTKSKFLCATSLTLPLTAQIIIGFFVITLQWQVTTWSQQARQRERSVSAARKASPQLPTTALSRSQSKTSGPKTLEQLRAKIRAELARPEVASTIFAVKIVSLDSNRVIYEENSRKMLVPASNMKIYTAAAVLDRLTPEYRFTTSIYAVSRPDDSGVVPGDLIIYGRGDPTFAPRFYDGDYDKGIDALADRIIVAGIKRIEGDLIGDETYFNGPSIGRGWEWDDLQWYYSAEISALTVSDNSVDLFVKPSPSLGQPALIDFKPNTSFVKIINHTVTTAQGTRRELMVNRPLGLNEIEISGGVPIDDPGLTTGNGFIGAVAVLKPALMFTTMLREALERRGVTIKGRTRTLAALTQQVPPSPTMRGLIEITNIQSPPLSEIVIEMLKVSQNLYAELLLRTVGKLTPQTQLSSSGPHTATRTSPPQTVQASTTDLSKITTAEAGVRAIKAFLAEIGIQDDEISIVDGSGLARTNLVSADDTIKLLTFMNRHPKAVIFRDALPSGGVDGTLKNRFKTGPATGNVHAKTGSLLNVSALSGYLTTAAGERLVFSLMINHSTEGSAGERSHLDSIVELLAAYNRRL